MASKRRVVRRMPSPARKMFDDQLWPVVMSLLVLGGFLVGTILAFQSFDEARWYANAWFSLTLAIVVLTTAVTAVCTFGSRFLRRAMQLAVVIGAIVHIALILLFHAANVFESLEEERDVVVRPTVKKQPRTIRRYVPENQKEDLQRDLHTPTEAPTLVKQKEKEPERERPRTTVREAQPVPVPDPQRVPTPEVVRRRAQSGTPRQNDQLSKASRQRQRSQKRMDLPTAADRVAKRQPNRAPRLASQQSQVGRQESQQSQSKRASSDPRQTPTNRSAASERRNVSRSQESSTTRSRDVPRRQRQQNPLAQVPTVEAPATSRQTSPTAPRPTTSLAEKANTASPVRQQPVPVPEVPDRQERRINRRQQQTPRLESVARTPTRTNTPRRKVTERVANVEVPVPSNATPRVASQAAPRAATTSPQRQPTRVNPQASRPSVSANAEPRVNRPVDRRQPNTSTNAVAESVPSPRRQSSRNLPTTDNSAEQVAGAARSKQPNLTAAATSQPRLSASNTARPMASQPRAATSNQPTPAVTRRRDVDAPAASRDNSAVARRTYRNRSQRTLQTATQAPIPNSANLANTGRSAAIQPALGSAARIQSQRTGQRSTTANAPATARSPDSHLAGRNDSPRNSTVPTVEPSRAAGRTPARSRNRGQLTTNTQVENPAANSLPSPNSSPALRAAARALVRADTGTAGAGRGANLDRMEGAKQNPAATASAAARRADSSQSTQPGPALTPRQPAAGRSRLSQTNPAVAFQAQSVPNPNAAGAKRPGSLNASAAAVQSLSQANARQGQVTGAKGAVEADTGVNQLVDENRTARAAGGGRPTINVLPSDSNDQRRGSAAVRGITTSQLAESVQSPASRDGGSPRTTPSPQASSLAQQTSGGDQPASGDPTVSKEAGDPQLAGTAGRLANLQPDRSRAGNSGADTLEEDEEDEEKKALRAAQRRSAGNRAAPALGTPLVVDVPQPNVRNADGGSAGGGSPSPKSTNLARDQARPAAAGEAGAAAPSRIAGIAGAQVGSNNIARASGARVEQTDGAAGAAEAGGGTASRRRMATGPALATNLLASVPTLAGGPQSSGDSSSVPIEAAGGLPNRIGGGAPNLNASADKAGGSVSSDAGQPGPAAGVANRRQSRNGATAEAELTDTGSTSSGRRGPGPSIATNVAADSVPSVGSVSGPGEPDMGDLAKGLQVGPMNRRASDAVQVSVEAAEGSGGLGLSPAPNTGVRSRTARPDSLNVQRSGARIVKRGAGAVPTLNTAATVAANPFRGRAGRPSGSNSSGLGPQTEAAIENGLSYLSRRQLADGRWSLQGHERRGGRDAQFTSDTAATGLALLAFQGAGYSHKQYKYKDRVRAAVKHLVSRQRDDGDLYDPGGQKGHAAIRLYSHSIAALALCEAYGMTQDPELREPAQKALDFIISAQHPRRGGWRYVPGQESDTSVTGWMMMALKSGDLAGLKVPKRTYDQIRGWLDAAKDPRIAHLYRYNPYAAESDQQSHGRNPTKSMTSVGMLMRLYLGWKRDHRQMVAGGDYLLKNLPDERDTYYWYYATQVMFHMRGKYWQKWNGRLYPMLIGSQVKSGAYAGSWDPWLPKPDRWAPHAGRIYVTTMNLLSLEVHYRHLPIYEETLLPRIWSWPQGVFQDGN